MIKVVMGDENRIDLGRFLAGLDQPNADAAPGVKQQPLITVADQGAGSETLCADPRAAGAQQQNGGIVPAHARA